MIFKYKSFVGLVSSSVNLHFLNFLVLSFLFIISKSALEESYRWSYQCFCLNHGLGGSVIVSLQFLSLSYQTLIFALLSHSPCLYEYVSSSLQLSLHIFLCLIRCLWFMNHFLEYVIYSYAEKVVVSFYSLKDEKWKNAWLQRYLLSCWI